MWIVFIAPPGGGKGTQAEKLIQWLGLTHLSTGDMLRDAIRRGTETGLLAKQYMDQGQLVPDEVIIDLVRQRIEQPDCAGGCLFDGFPRTLAQAEALDALLGSRNTPLDAVVELRVDDEEILRRIAGRRAQSAEKRSDDDPEVVPKRLAEYHRLTLGLLEYYRRRGVLQTVDGTGSIDDVFARVQAAVQQQGST